MSDERKLQDLERRMGYSFRDRGLLSRALTHPSREQGAGSDNQRLEFFGDRVLGLVMSEIVMRDEQASVGDLAVRFNSLVSGTACAAVARSIDLGDALKLGRSARMTSGRRTQGVLADAMEAVIGAIYLDGGLNAARSSVRKIWSSQLEEVPVAEQDPKTRLQIWTQARGEGLPTYRILARTGPDHAVEFLVEARLPDERTARASAGSKRLAEQHAARKLLDMISAVHD